MASVNRVCLLGNVGKDPEVRYAPSGSAICNVTLATSRQWKDKTSGEKKEETEWSRLVFYDRQAEVVGEYVKKGSPIYVEGRLKTRKWADKEGVEKYTTEIIVSELQLLGKRDDTTERQQTHGEQRAAARPAPPKSSTGFDDMPDDIPF